MGPEGGGGTEGVPQITFLSNWCVLNRDSLIGSRPKREICVCVIECESDFSEFAFAERNVYLALSDAHSRICVLNKHAFETNKAADKKVYYENAKQRQNTAASITIQITWGVLQRSCHHKCDRLLCPVTACLCHPGYLFPFP